MAFSAGKNYKRPIGALLAAVACLASGCTSPPVTSETRAELSPKAVQLAAGDGMLAVKVAINRQQVNRYFKKFHTLVVWNADRQQEFVLVDRSDSSATHSYFAGSLPPGTYAIRAIKSEVDNAQVEGWYRPDVKERFPGFTVAAGRLTDLGSIAFIRAHDPPGTGRHAWGQVDAPYDQAAELRQFAPALAATLAAQPALGWDADARLQTLRKTLDDMRSLSMQANAPARLADGTMLFGEAFGRIAVRTPAGAWQTVQTPAALPIRAIHAASDGTLLAGSDEGILMIRRAAGAGWDQLALPVDDGSVIDIGPLPGTDELLVVLQTRDRFLGLSTSRASPGTGTWTERFSRPRQLFRASGADAQGLVVRSGDSLVFASGSLLARQETLTWDSKLRSWKPAALDTDGVPYYWTVLADGSLVRFEGIPLTGGRFFNMSSDGGAHWEKRAKLPFRWGPLVFVSDQTGYVVCTAGPPDFERVGNVDFTPSLWRTDDTGRTWTQVNGLPAFPRRLVDLGQPGHLGYASDDGRFFSSTDGGKHWTLEKQVP